ncbi:premelanosome protein a [Denticeps clupeoides]|uniref:PKD domain-containing protein n=1 Tax=Denticeps clupeoides TaxID=299321 RepID=A0AAY4C8G1_9TELE|nr:melanocyte protein PMEL [Denticeps clupeoides]
MRTVLVTLVFLLTLAATNGALRDSKTRFARYRSWNSRMYPVWRDGDPRYRTCWKGGEVTFDLRNDAPTLTGAKATFNIDVKFPVNQTVLPDGQVVWARNCTINGTQYREGQPVFPGRSSADEWTGVFPDGTPYTSRSEKKPNYIFVWKAWGRYWQVADGPSSSLTIGTDNIPLGSYNMEVVIYHSRSKDRFVPLGYASTRFSVIDQIPFQVTLSQVNDINQGDQNFIQNRAVAFSVTLHDPSQYLSSSDVTFTWDFGDNSGTLISRDPTVTHTYLSSGSFRPQVVLMAAIPNECEVNPTLGGATIEPSIPVEEDTTDAPAEDPSIAPVDVATAGAVATVDPAAPIATVAADIALAVPASAAAPADGTGLAVDVPAAEVEEGADAVATEDGTAAADLDAGAAAEAATVAAAAEDQALVVAEPTVVVAAEEAAVVQDATEVAAAVDAETAAEDQALVVAEPTVVVAAEEAAVVQDATEVVAAVDAETAAEDQALVVAEPTVVVAAEEAAVVQDATEVVAAVDAETAAEDQALVVAEPTVVVAAEEAAVVQDATEVVAAVDAETAVIVADEATLELAATNLPETPAAEDAGVAEPAEPTEVATAAVTEVTAAVPMEAEIIETVNEVAAVANEAVAVSVAPTVASEAVVNEVDAGPEAAEVALVIAKRQAPEAAANSDCTIYRYGSFSTNLDIIQGIESVEIVQVNNVVTLTTEVEQNAVDLTVTCQGSLPSEVCTVVSDADCTTPVQTVCNAVTPSPECQMVLRQFFNDSGVFCINVSLSNDVSFAVTSARVSVAVGSESSTGGTVAAVLGVLVLACVAGMIALAYKRFKHYQPLVEDSSSDSGTSGRTSVPLLLWNLLSRQSVGESRPLLQGRVV